MRIALEEFCDYFHVDIELVKDFAEYGLYQAVVYEDEVEIETQEIDRLKRIISLHQALGINKEGIEVILDLGERISELHEEIGMLRIEVDRLRRALSNEEPEMLKRLGLLIELGD